METHFVSTFPSGDRSRSRGGDCPRHRRKRLAAHPLQRGRRRSCVRHVRARDVHRGGAERAYRRGGGDVPRVHEGASSRQHYAMTYLGFATGLRPSLLRPLRRTGPTPDVLWDEGVVLVRRSHTLGDEVMNTTKTKLRQRITVPPEVMDVLRWHVDTQLTTPEQKASELLFPAEDGGFRSVSFLKKAFATVAQLIGLKKHVHAARACAARSTTWRARRRSRRSSPRASPATRPTACASTTRRSPPTSSDESIGNVVEPRDGPRPVAGAGRRPKWGAQWGGCPTVGTVERSPRA